MVTHLLPLMLSSASDLMNLMSAGMVANCMEIGHMILKPIFTELEHASENFSTRDMLTKNLELFNMMSLEWLRLCLILCNLLPG